MARGTMTVGELRAELADYSDADPVEVYSYHDRGYLSVTRMGGDPATMTEDIMKESS